MRNSHFIGTLLLVGLALVSGSHVFADYLVVVTTIGNVVHATARSTSTSINSTGYTTDTTHTVYWLDGVYPPDDLLSPDRVSRYTFNGAAWTLRDSAVVVSDTATVNARKYTPFNPQCVSFALPAGNTSVRLVPERPLPDATFMVHVMILSGPPTGYHYITGRDTTGCTLTFTSNGNDITGIATFVDCHH